MSIVPVPDDWRSSLRELGQMLNKEQLLDERWAPCYFPHFAGVTFRSNIMQDVLY